MPLHRVLPVRQPLITTRRHPLAFAAYAVVFAFGMMFLTGVLGDSHSSVFKEIPDIWQYLWEWELVSGGGVALFALIVRPKVFPHWPDYADVLRFEGIGGIVGGVGMFTYSVILLQVLTWQSYSWVLMMILGLGMTVRGVQAIIESVRIERIGALTDAAAEILTEALTLREAHELREAQEQDEHDHEHDEIYREQ